MVLCCLVQPLAEALRGQCSLVLLLVLLLLVHLTHAAHGQGFPLLHLCCPSCGSCSWSEGGSPACPLYAWPVHL